MKLSVKLTISPLSDLFVTGD